MEIGGQGSIIVSGFEATNGGELVLNPGADEIVITDNGTYPLDPGTYTAIIRFEDEVVAGPMEFTIGDCPEPSEEVTASILIAKFDTRGTADTDDDVMLDGASFEVYLDDGDETFDDGDELVFGPATTEDGLLDTDQLEAGQYWIVEAVVPAGFTGSDPILVELNTDSSVTCVWDALGLIECEENVDNVDGLSWTIVLVDNAPIASTPSPTGGVGGATGTPRRDPPADRHVVRRNERSSRRRLAPHPPGDGRPDGGCPSADPGQGRGPQGRSPPLIRRGARGAPAVPEHRRPSGPKGLGGRRSWPHRARDARCPPIDSRRVRTATARA